jgi:hypothetical protein
VHALLLVRFPNTCFSLILHFLNSIYGANFLKLSFVIIWLWKLFSLNCIGFKCVICQKEAMLESWACNSVVECSLRMRKVWSSTLHKSTCWDSFLLPLHIFWPTFNYFDQFISFQLEFSSISLFTESVSIWLQILFSFLEISLCLICNNSQQNILHSIQF